MTERSSRDEILQAAVRLFAERGYAHVTIRQIAAEAGVSPALVMKLGGSKQEIYASATPRDLAPLDPNWPNERIGVELVRRILDRRGSAVNEPWLQSLIAVIEAPEPQDARNAFVSHYVSALERRIDGDNTRSRAELIAAMLVGLASAVRALRLLANERDWIIERYGAMIQSIVDDTTPTT